MNVLIACEESQAVVTEFRNHGINAFSCDILKCSGGHPEWHINSDVIPLLNGCCTFKTEDGKRYKITNEWDAIIAFPPCTDLAVSGTKYFEVKRNDGRQRKAIEFFCSFFNAKCNHIAIENPVNIIGGKYITKYFPDLCEKFNLPRKPNQRIQPWMFGDNFSKTTCLWLKGLPELHEQNAIKPEIEYLEWVDPKTGKKKKQDKWSAYMKHKDRGLLRSKTFPGIAKAMGEQWTAYLNSQKEV